MSAFTKPIVVANDGSSTTLKRVPLTLGMNGQFNEQWLQEILFRNPNALPITEIDPHVGDLVPVCIELPTDAGPADILYVTKTGQIALVETKLWRNAEARRVVVAQILDYAKELSAWRYEDLIRQTAIASKAGSGYLLACVRRAFPDLDEAEFVDGINRSLAQGDFLLIIAGDGIRSDAESLVGFIEQYANLRFKLALVEVAAYILPDASFLLQPRLLVKTVVLERTVFVGLPREPREAHDAPGDADDPTRAARNALQLQWFERFWAEFIGVLRLDDLQQPQPARPGRSPNLALQMPPGQGQAWISAYIAQSQNMGGVFLTFLKSFTRSQEFYDALYEQRSEIDAIVPGLSWKREANGKVWIEVPTVTLGDLDDDANRARVIAYLTGQTNRMVNAFRHRLKDLSRATADLN